MFRTLTATPLPVVMRSQAHHIKTTDREDVIVLSLGTVDPEDTGAQPEDTTVALDLEDAARLIKVLANAAYEVVHHAKAKG